MINRTLACLVTAACISLPLSSPALENPFLTDTPAQSAFEDYVRGHFDIGLRTISYSFTRPDEAANAEDSFYDDASGRYIEGYFIGSIDELREDPEQGLGLQNLFISWWPLASLREWVGQEEEAYPVWLTVIEGLGLDLTWANVRGETWTSLETDGAGNYIDGDYSDGTVVAEAPIVSLIVKIKNPSPVTPYFGLGTANFSDPDVTEGWWHWGFGGDTWYDANASYQAWRNAGSPGNPNGGYRRTFEVDGARADVWMIGVDIQVHENLALDFYYREMDVVFDNTYTTSVNDTPLQIRYSKWDMSNTAYGFGLRCSF